MLTIKMKHRDNGIAGMTQDMRVLGCRPMVGHENLGLAILVRVQTSQIYSMMLYEEILREFQKQKVKYVLVGGIAINLLGLLRSTADLDILVEMSNENLRKVVSILKEKGYRVKQPVDPMGIANYKIRHDWIHNKHMKAFNFYKEDELKEVDIIIESPISYKEAKKDTLKFKIEDITLPVISLDNLIKMKKCAGRSVDKFDIEELKKIKKLKRIK